MHIPTVLLCLILFFSATFATHINHQSRRVLHQPFFPQNSPPPTEPPTPSPPTPPKYPFSSSASAPTNSPFFPTYPSPPPPPSPPSPPSPFASFPANISSLSLPQPSKPKPVSSKLIAAAVSAVLAALIILSISIFLHIKRRRRNQSFDSDSKTHTSNNSTPFHSSRNNPNSHLPKLQRPSQTSSEFLYLGTLVNSHGATIDQTQNSRGNSGTHNSNSINPRKMDSPELRPLPPLSGQQQSFGRNYSNATGVCPSGRAGEEEDEEFYSPRGSARESSMGNGSASRRFFAAVHVENLSGSGSSSSSYSGSSSASGSPVRSVSLSISPPVSLSPKGSRPKSPELTAIQTAPPPPPPPQPQQEPVFVGPFVDSNSNSNRESFSSSPISSFSPERDLRRSPSPVSSPRISSGSDRDLGPIERSSSPEKHNEDGFADHVSLPRTSSSSGRDLDYFERSSSPEKQNEILFVASPPPPPLPPPPSRASVNSPSLPVSFSSPPPAVGDKLSTPPTLSVVPPPPPPPPARLWESPRTPTPQSRKIISEPPVLVTHLRPIDINSPTLISPMQLPENLESNATNEESAERSEYSSEALERSEETPKPKLKPLHWDKVRASSDREMVWDQLKSSSFKLDEQMIETLFVVNTPSSNPKETTRRQVLPSPTQENRVLDPKKSQNIAISLRALNVTIEEVCEALMEGNVDTLGTELLESLLKMAPTKEEERKLKEYKDDSPFKLGPAEKFLKAVLDVPFAFKRVDAMLYISNFDSEVEYLKKSFETLEAACEELRSSRMFLKLLEAVLKTGNRMNVGTNRGDAHAFKLDTLLKLVDVKGADGKTTLLHFVVQEIIRSEGARLSSSNQNQPSTVNDDAKCRKLGLQVVSGLSAELANVKKAAAMDSEVLSGDVLKLSRGIGNIAEVVRLNATIVKDDSNSEKFSESMNRFMKQAEESIIRIQAQESVALSLVKEITEYFHGNSAKEEAHPFRIFMVVRDFLTVLDRVCKEVGMINERTIVSSAHKFPVPVNPMLQPVFNGFPGRRQSSSSDDES